MTRKDINLSRQLNHAISLAHEFGHEWAVAIWETVPDTPEEAEEAYTVWCQKQRELHGENFGRFPYPGSGIEIPEFGETISHTTSTGRLSWVIYPTGMVKLTINRPANPKAPHPYRGNVPVLEATVAYVSTTTNEKEVTLHYCSELAKERHWATMEQAVNALSWLSTPESWNIKSVLNDKDEGEKIPIQCIIARS